MAKNIGYGSALAVATSTGGTTTIAAIRSISGPGTDATDVDTTCLDSSSNFRTFAAGPIDPGEVTFQLAYSTTEASHGRLADMHENKTSYTFTLTHNTSGSDTDTFSAYVKSLGREIPLDDLITQDVGLKVSGLPGYTT